VRNKGIIIINYYVIIRKKVEKDQKILYQAEDGKARSRRAKVRKMEHIN
jgi:hypothetical protein